MRLRNSNPPKFLVVDGCPCPYEVAPQVHMMLSRAGQHASSIYRGSDPAGVKILHAHNKHTQAELYELSINGTPSQRAAAGLPPGGGGVNRPGTSQHELKSDGHANPPPVGRNLSPWSIGIDSGENTMHDVDAIRSAAKSYGWYVRHPYSAGVEKHHWCFGSPPKAKSPWQSARIAYWQRMLPRS